MTLVGGLWDTLLPATLVLVGFNLVLGGLAVSLLRNAAKAEVQ